MNKLLAALTACMPLFFMIHAANAQTGAAVPEPTANPDLLFLRKAAQAGMAEVAGGRAAQTQAMDPTVKTFGAMMIKDHGKANDSIEALAAAKRIDLPTTAGGAESGKLAEVKALAGSDFDRAYVGWQILAHKEAIALFKEEGASGDDPDIKSFAQTTLPTLQSHLRQLETLQLPPPPT